MPLTITYERFAYPTGRLAVFVPLFHALIHFTVRSRVYLFIFVSGNYFDSRTVYTRSNFSCSVVSI